jgi:hypothetical protein
VCRGIRVLAGHLQDEQPDGQAGEGGDGAGGGGQPVREDDRAAGLGLDVADVPGDADRETHDRGRPGPDPLPSWPAVEVGDEEGEFPIARNTSISAGQDLACQPLSRW